MGHLLKYTPNQRIEFELRDASGILVTGLSGLTVLLSQDNSVYFTGSGTTSLVNSKRLCYRPTTDETNCTRLSIEASHTGAARDYYDSFFMAPIVNTAGYVTINNTLPTLDGSGYVTINNDLPLLDGSRYVTINNTLPNVVSGAVYIYNDLPTLDVNGYVTINNPLPTLDGSGYVTINNTLPTLHPTGSVYTHMLPNLAEIKEQVVASLSGDTYPEPGYGAPSSTVSLAAKINQMYKATINKSTQTAGVYSLFNSSGTTVDQKAITSDDSVTFTRNKLIGG